MNEEENKEKTNLNEENEIGIEPKEEPNEVPKEEPKQVSNEVPIIDKKEHVNNGKPKKNKTALIVTGILAVILCVVGLLLIFNKPQKEGQKEQEEQQEQKEKLKELPKPEVTGGSRGELGIDKNINESTIDEYLNRPDAVYRDMRMLEDPATYENIGGDRFLSGYIEGFEVVPLPYIIPVTGLPGEVGKTYEGNEMPLIIMKSP